MIYMTVHNKASGRILRQVSTSDRQVDGQLQDNEGCIWGHYDEATYWVPGRLAVARPEFDIEAPSAPLAPGQEHTLTPLPEGTDVSIDGQHAATLDDSGYLDLSFDKVGAYRVRLELFPYKTKELTLEVSR